MTQTADIVICGAGITGVSAAHLLSKPGFKNILLVDERRPSLLQATVPPSVTATGGPTPKRSP